MSELLELCGSDDLSSDALQEIINTLGPRVSSQSQLCLHRACENENVTLETVQLLHNTFPEALRLRDDDGQLQLPIHWLCMNGDLDETVSIDILLFMLEIDPALPREVDNDDWLPLHVAVQYKSTAFCKILIDKYPQSLRVESDDGWLPIHIIAYSGERDDIVDTIKYMLELDPELLLAEDNNGYLPIHWAAEYGRTDAIELLLKYDPDAVSKEVINGSQRLPLHIACSDNITSLSSIQVLYDAYPDAIFVRDRLGRTPLDIAQMEGDQPAMEFLQTQLVYARQAQDVTAMTSLDENGQLPLHRALKDNASLGSITLLLIGNRAALQVTDQKGAYPLHIACEFSPVKVVKYLVELSEYNLNNVDAKNNSLLHYACRGGSLSIVNFLLGANVPSVSDRNNNKKLAIHLLLECGENVDRESMEYVETVHQLLLANPEVVRDFMPY